MKRAIAAKNFEAKRSNVGSTTVDARLETRAKQVLHEKKGEITQSSPNTKMKEKNARGDNRHPPVSMRVGKPLTFTVEEAAFEGNHEGEATTQLVFFPLEILLYFCKAELHDG